MEAESEKAVAGSKRWRPSQRRLSLGRVVEKPMEAVEAVDEEAPGGSGGKGRDGGEQCWQGGAEQGPDVKYPRLAARMSGKGKGARSLATATHRAYDALSFV